MIRFFIKILFLFVSVNLFLYISGCSKTENSYNPIKASGFIEAREVDIRSEISGKIVSLGFEEGDKFKKDEMLCMIDREKLEFQLKQAEAKVGEIRARLSLLKRGLRKEEIDKAKNLVQELTEKRDLARTEYERTKELFEKGVLSKSAFDTAKTALKMAEEERLGTQRQYEIAKNGYRKEEIDESQFALKGAELRVEAIKRNIMDSEILSPATGIITKKVAEEGEYVPSGGLIATITDLSYVWLKIYLPENEYGKVMIGQKVKIKIDSFPKKYFDGKIIYISSEAEFTPKNIQTQEDRVKLVYALKVGINNSEGIFKPGMPADAFIEVEIASLGSQ
ncbi:MAG: hypothetical protein A3C43_09780 [Candidatus Schekmanbacteria bacterium RIFCSPHIGHO2_02_FULL_38_11]|uniref:RND efflux pump membrane fusion protein barrel-sandwich domain-containing protein n=1 Tax=Candidatus Schekmanbacteria bacterium RIFCSPLOWO2_12_FULL_38_15 TaxID=1817883 RepID=A0A1F7SIM0_9BACT|nr:MAG: hypothetical protein A2043_04670 [Candidatus Schekmanbacteria bacterium GWA2_38_9]OGL49674.1 MAG: hypothetical protein A3H37_01405 [Candidatus Schekmanbacteria bacterium RIFCSPLOWO2_02_FULL_38_14]OGL51916.1 MAG: hypothetical protein A3C43_09780 [Candidatus Schekmanbacteria bacterium RIFCSPHIGHO2_02_FULL_38_11]OGL53027.1 MAG: hypothetical protein A3G31_08960 [Candidatus Schekmanbacteria bacterium RIFCSPLOWO2_12_FULL_38_15]